MFFLKNEFEETYKNNLATLIYFLFLCTFPFFIWKFWKTLSNFWKIIYSIFFFLEKYL